jgi:hypothetical protein
MVYIATLSVRRGIFALLPELRQKTTVLSPAALGTKNYCAGEDQEQFS